MHLPRGRVRVAQRTTSAAFLQYVRDSLHGASAAFSARVTVSSWSRTAATPRLCRELTGNLCGHSRGGGMRHGRPQRHPRKPGRYVARGQTDIARPIDARTIRACRARRKTCCIFSFNTRHSGPVNTLRSPVESPRYREAARQFAARYARVDRKEQRDSLLQSVEALRA